MMSGYCAKNKHRMSRRLRIDPKGHVNSIRNAYNFVLFTSRYYTEEQGPRGATWIITSDNRRAMLSHQGQNIISVRKVKKTDTLTSDETFSETL